jgi:hypothetical protein
MERLWTYGNTYILAHDGMTFIAFKSIINKDTVDIIGCYKDKLDIVKRIRRGSVFGKLVLETLERERE